MYSVALFIRITLAILVLPLGTTALDAQEAVTLAELEGHKVTATIVRAQVVRRDSRDIPTRHENFVQLVFEPQGMLNINVKNTVHGPKGARPGENTSGHHAIETPGRAKGRGGGAALHVFENGMLTMMRTYAAGAFMRKIEFKRTPSGLGCTVTEAHARENGTGEVRLKSSTDGQMVTIVSSKQISSSCEVSR